MTMYLVLSAYSHNSYFISKMHAICNAYPILSLVTKMIHTTYDAMDSKICKGFVLATDVTWQPG